MVIDYEFLSGIRRHHRVGELDAVQAEDAIAALSGLNITRHPAHRLVERMWDMRENITTYDASYVALAEALDVPLMTADQRLARAASRYCEVVPI